MKRSIFFEALEVLQNRDKFLSGLTEYSKKGRTILSQLLMIFIFTFIYGAIMGSYNGFAQALSSGVKLWMLLIATLIICFPSFYIVQLILGSKIRIEQLLVTLLGGFVMVSVTMLAFGPIILFFQLSGDNYQFLQILHVFVFGFSGIFGMKVVLDALKVIFEGKGIYPRMGLTVFKIWVIIFAFVGIQLSWNMRPFVGSKDMDFQLFRTETQGNFYSTVLSSIGHLFGMDRSEADSGNVPGKQPSDGNQNMTVDSLLLINPTDSTQADLRE